MKRIICFLICALMLFGTLCFSSSAEEAVIESPHPYPNSSNTKFSYTADEPADFLAVVFSPLTAVENKYDRIYIYASDRQAATRAPSFPPKPFL
ncbi:MAG: hypothetical protein MJ177_08455 [Clostridia bacterium]|nr:hypothetical protein [Clostridia bacterium]